MEQGLLALFKPPVARGGHAERVSTKSSVRRVAAILPTPTIDGFYVLRSKHGYHLPIFNLDPSHMATALVTPVCLGNDRFSCVAQLTQVLLDEQSFLLSDHAIAKFSVPTKCIGMRELRWADVTTVKLTSMARLQILLWAGLTVQATSLADPPQAGSLTDLLFKDLL